MSRKQELVAIPAWNEEGSIAQVIAKVREHRPTADILVVDDGSTDTTGAFLYAQREGYEAVVQVDADGQHDPADLERVLDGLSDADIVVGTRFHPESLYFVGGPRRWAMIMLSKALSRMNRGMISDPTSGFRSAGPRAIELFAVEYPADYLGDTVGSLAIAIRDGLVVHETPVTMYFRQAGRPSKNALWSALYLGRATLAILATALKSRRTPRGDAS